MNGTIAYNSTRWVQWSSTKAANTITRLPDGAFNTITPLANDMVNTIPPTPLTVNPTPAPDNPTPLAVNPTPSTPNLTPSVGADPTPLTVNPTPVPGANPTPIADNPTPVAGAVFKLGSVVPAKSTKFYGFTVSCLPVKVRNAGAAGSKGSCYFIVKDKAKKEQVYLGCSLKKIRFIKLERPTSLDPRMNGDSPTREGQKGSVPWRIGNRCQPRML